MGCGKSTTVVKDGNKKTVPQGSSNFVSVPSTYHKGEQPGSAKPSTAQNSHDLGRPKESPKPSPKQLLDIKPKPELPVNKPESRTSQDLPPVRNPKAASQLISAQAKVKPGMSTTQQMPEPEAEIKVQAEQSPEEAKLQTHKNAGKPELSAFSHPTVNAEARKAPEPEKQSSGAMAYQRRPAEAIEPEKKLPEPILVSKKPPNSLLEDKSPEPVPEKSPENTLPTVFFAGKEPLASSGPQAEERKLSNSPPPAREEDKLAALVHTDLQSLYSHAIFAVDEEEIREQSVERLVREVLQGLYERVLATRNQRDEDPVAADYLQGLYSRVLAE